jgi:hypothetical protein
MLKVLYECNSLEHSMFFHVILKGVVIRFLEWASCPTLPLYRDAIMVLHCFRAEHYNGRILAGPREQVKV